MDTGYQSNKSLLHTEWYPVWLWLPQRTHGQMSSVPQLGQSTEDRPTGQQWYSNGNYVSMCQQAPILEPTGQ